MHISYVCVCVCVCVNGGNVAGVDVDAASCVWMQLVCIVLFRTQACIYVCMDEMEACMHV
jgi:hypothetical protein